MVGDMGETDGVERVRVVVEGGNQPIDALVRADAMLSFIVGCHLSMPGVDIYVEGELIDAEEVAQEFLASRSAAQSAGSTTAASTRAPVPAETFSIPEAKSLSELMHMSLSALIRVQLDTFAECSKAAKALLADELARNKTFAADIAEQREQHRKALSEIDIFNRGAHVAMFGNYAALQAGRARRPESEGMALADVIEGFFPDKRSAG